MNAKKYLSWMVIPLLCAAILSDCTRKEEVGLVQPKSQSVNVNISTVDLSNSYVKYALKTTAFIYAERTLDGAKIERIQLAQTNGDQNQKGLIVSVNSLDGVQRDIMIATVFGENSADDQTVAMIREQNVTSNMDGNKAVYSGFIRWKMADGTKINEMMIESNKIRSLKTFSWSNARVASTLGCCWACTKAQFNATYQHYKSECENDVDCDFPCSFAPCAIAYLISAINDCTDCSQG